MERWEREQAIYAGWPDCSADWLNTDLRFLDAKRVENGQWTLIKSSGDHLEICDLGGWASRRDSPETSGQARSKSAVF